MNCTRSNQRLAVGQCQAAVEDRSRGDVCITRQCRNTQFRNEFCYSHSKQKTQPRKFVPSNKSELTPQLEQLAYYKKPIQNPKDFTQKLFASLDDHMKQNMQSIFLERLREVKEEFVNNMRFNGNITKEQRKEILGSISSAVDTYTQDSSEAEQNLVAATQALDNANAHRDQMQQTMESLQMSSQRSAQEHDDRVRGLELRLEETEQKRIDLQNLQSVKDATRSDEDAARSRRDIDNLTRLEKLQRDLLYFELRVQQCHDNNKNIVQTKNNIIAQLQQRLHAQEKEIKFRVDEKLKAQEATRDFYMVNFSAMFEKVQQAVSDQSPDVPRLLKDLQRGISRLQQAKPWEDSAGQSQVTSHSLNRLMAIQKRQEQMLQNDNFDVAQIIQQNQLDDAGEGESAALLNVINQEEKQRDQVKFEQKALLYAKRLLAEQEQNEAAEEEVEEAAEGAEGESAALLNVINQEDEQRDQVKLEQKALLYAKRLLAEQEQNEAAEEEVEEAAEAAEEASSQTFPQLGREYQKSDYNLLVRFLNGSILQKQIPRLVGVLTAENLNDFFKQNFTIKKWIEKITPKDSPYRAKLLSWFGRKGVVEFRDKKVNFKEPKVDVKLKPPLQVYVPREDPRFQEPKVDSKLKPSLKVYVPREDPRSQEPKRFPRIEQDRKCIMQFTKFVNNITEKNSPERLTKRDSDRVVDVLGAGRLNQFFDVEFPLKEWKTALHKNVGEYKDKLIKSMKTHGLDFKDGTLRF